MSTKSGVPLYNANQLASKLNTVHIHIAATNKTFIYNFKNTRAQKIAFKTKLNINFTNFSI